MTGHDFAETQGGLRGRRWLRVAIWIGLFLFGIYLAGAAMASDPALAGRALALGVTEAAARADAGKADIFRRPTTADPREEIACLALNIYFEARGEPDLGQLAVAHVVMNRVLSGRFPSTICEVVRQGGELRRHRCQFSWWCDGRSDRPEDLRDWQRSSEYALAVYWGRSQDPTAGALWYHADYVDPYWRHDFVQGPKIGRHIFYHDANSAVQLVSR